AKAAAPSSTDSARPSTGSGRADGDRVIASPLAKRIAADKGLDLKAVKGTGPHGRIVKADVEGAKPGAAAPAPVAASAPSAAPVQAQDFGIPHEVEKLSGMRKTIARRLTESK